LCDPSANIAAATLIGGFAPVYRARSPEAVGWCMIAKTVPAAGTFGGPRERGG